MERKKLGTNIEKLERFKESQRQNATIFHHESQSMGTYANALKHVQARVEGIIHEFQQKATLRR